MLPSCKGEQCITTIPSNNWAQSLDVAVRQPLSAVLWQTNSEAGQTFQDNIEYHFPSGHLYCSKSHRIGWWENLQETHIFHGKNLGLRLRFSQENPLNTQPKSSPGAELPGVHGSNTGITAIACIKAGSLCASLGDYRDPMEYGWKPHISVITYIRVAYHINDTYDQLILFTIGILWLLIIPPLLVHAIIWYMYILIYIWWGSWNWTVPFPFPMEVSHPTLAFATASRAVLTAAMTCDLLMEAPKNKTYSLYFL